MVLRMAVHKTTVYLPETLKRDLGRVAAETRRSEAELIPEGIKLVVARHDPPFPHVGIFDSGDPTLADRVEDLLAGFGEQ